MTRHTVHARRIRRAAALTLAGFLVGGCASLPGQSAALAQGASLADPQDGRNQTDSLSDRQVQILNAADEMLQTQNFVVDGYRYNYDCTGTILAIYAMAGVRLIDLFPRYSGNGVHRLYGIAEDRDLLYQTKYPQPGDLIFWDNTYDKNGDKLWNDPLTHVGLVLAVSANGEIDYLHHDYSKGVVRAKMNLNEPLTYEDRSGRIVNSPMRMKSDRYLNPDVWLAGQLYREMGAMYRIRM